MYQQASFPGIPTTWESRWPEGSIYGFQLAAVFSDYTQAGALTAVTEETIVDDVQGVQILTQTSPLVANAVDFQWTAPMEPKEGSVFLKVASNSANGNFSPTGDAINTLEVSIPLGADTLTTFVPVVLSAVGKNNSFFTSELTLTNRGSEAAMLNYTYTAEAGGGSGTATDMLGPQQQKIQSNAINYLRELEVPIPETGNRVGTLRVDVSGSSDVSVVVRTTTEVPEGRAGLAYLGIPGHEGFQDEAVYLCGLRETELDRSNVALQNMGAEGSITLRTTVFSGNPADRSGHMLDDQILGPGEFHQHNAVLKEKGDPINGGYVKVERVEGTAPFYAYGVINDNANSGRLLCLSGQRELAVGSHGAGSAGGGGDVTIHQRTDADQLLGPAEVADAQRHPRRHRDGGEFRLLRSPAAGSRSAVHHSQCDRGGAPTVRIQPAERLGGALVRHRGRGRHERGRDRSPDGVAGRSG